MKHAREDYERFQDPAGIIPKDEPVFLLRAQDRHAAATLRYYAGRLSIDPKVDPDMVKMIKDHADAMDEWPVKKPPDV